MNKCRTQTRLQLRLAKHDDGVVPDFMCNGIKAVMVSKEERILSEYIRLIQQRGSDASPPLQLTEENKQHLLEQQRYTDTKSHC